MLSKCLFLASDHAGDPSLAVDEEEGEDEGTSTIALESISQTDVALLTDFISPGDDEKPKKKKKKRKK